MQDPAIWAYEPVIDRYHHFIRKEQFELPVDRLPQWVVFAIEDGECTYTIGETSGTAKGGTLILCPPHIPLVRATVKPLTFHFFVFRWMNASGEYLPVHLAPQTTELQFHNTARYYASLSLLQDLSQGKNIYLNQWRGHILNDILRLYMTERFLPVVSNENADAYHMMIEAKARIDQDFDKQGHIEQIAFDFGISPVKFSRLFKRMFGINPSEYLINLRIQKVCHLLTHTNHSLEKISAACGINNGFYLSRIFKKKMGVTPSQYRLAKRV